MTSFNEFNLDPQISKALAACGYTQPTPIQAKSIPAILLGNDVVASAQTGTGKTAAFVLPALHRLAAGKAGNKPRVLILTPTRELASQITLATEKYGKFLRFNIVSLVGGMPYRQQLRSLSRPVDVIVATPGRLLDHMSNRRLDLSEIEMLVLDEADRMLDMGFIDDVRDIANKTPDDRQTLLFSATVDNKLTQVIRQLLKDPVKIDFSHENLTPAKITQELYLADHPQHKKRLLQHFISQENIFKAIIFTATKINADRLAGDLQEQGFAAAPLHGDLKQNLRNRTVEDLRRGKIQFLVATDVAARGIDINDVTHVFNFDLPKFSEDYVHRIGRTGRAGKTGIAISFALPSDTRHVQNIERLMKQQLERKTIEGLEPSKHSSSDRSSPPNKSRKSSGGKSRFSSDAPVRKNSFKKKEGSEKAQRFYADRHTEKDARPPRRENRKPESSGKRFSSSDSNDRRRSSSRTAEPTKRFYADSDARKDRGSKSRSNTAEPNRRFYADNDVKKERSNRPDSRTGERSNRSDSRTNERSNRSDTRSAEPGKRFYADKGAKQDRGSRDRASTRTAEPSKRFYADRNSTTDTRKRREDAPRSYRDDAGAKPKKFEGGSGDSKITYKKPSEKKFAGSSSRGKDAKFKKPGEKKFVKFTSSEKRRGK